MALVAPMFLHMNFMHLLFNMSWAVNLGGMIEREKRLENVPRHCSLHSYRLMLCGILLGYLWTRKTYDFIRRFLGSHLWHDRVRLDVCPELQGNLPPALSL